MNDNTHSTQHTQDNLGWQQYFAGIRLDDHLAEVERSGQMSGSTDELSNIRALVADLFDDIGLNSYVFNIEQNQVRIAEINPSSSATNDRSDWGFTHQR